MRISLGNIASYLSVLIWGATSAFVLQCESIPPFFLVGLATLVLGLIQAAGIIKNDGLKGLKVKGQGWLLVIAAYTGYRALYFPSLFMIDPIEASNLAQLWLAVALVFGILDGRMELRHYAGAGCVVAALAIILHDGVSPAHFMALSAGIWFGWYVVYSPNIKGLEGPAGAVGNLSGGLMMLYFSVLAGESWLIAEWGLFWLAASLFVTNIGVLLWGYGARHGISGRGKIAVLFSPIIAAGWICLLEGFLPSGSEIASTAAVTLAALILSPHVLKAEKTARLKG